MQGEQIVHLFFNHLYIQRRNFKIKLSNQFILTGSSTVEPSRKRHAIECFVAPDGDIWEREREREREKIFEKQWEKYRGCTHRTWAAAGYCKSAFRCHRDASKCSPDPDIRSTSQGRWKSNEPRLKRLISQRQPVTLRASSFLIIKWLHVYTYVYTYAYVMYNMPYARMHSLHASSYACTPCICSVFHICYIIYIYIHINMYIYLYVRIQVVSRAQIDERSAYRKTMKGISFDRIKISFNCQNWKLKSNLTKFDLLEKLKGGEIIRKCSILDFSCDF